MWWINSISFYDLHQFKSKYMGNVCVYRSAACLCTRLRIYYKHISLFVYVRVSLTLSRHNYLLIFLEDFHAVCDHMSQYDLQVGKWVNQSEIKTNKQNTNFFKWNLNFLIDIKHNDDTDFKWNTCTEISVLAQQFWLIYSFECSGAIHMSDDFWHRCGIATVCSNFLHSLLVLLLVVNKWMCTAHSITL